MRARCSATAHKPQALLRRVVQLLRLLAERLLLAVARVRSWVARSL
tara:strand:+ start:782 stop:919 length:138 start_codon:yes stop_codon:yes gene_type:complete